MSGLADRARSWLRSGALTSLVRALDGPSDAAGQHEALLRWSASTLDTRAGAERRDAAPVQWGAHWVRALLRAGDELGLMRTADPLLTNYDAALVLGGATTGNRLRVAKAGAIVGAGVRVGELVLLGAERPLGAREVDEEPDSAGDGTEWRNLQRYAAQAFGPLDVVESEAGGRNLCAWRDVRYRSSGPRVRLLVAPSSRAGHRAGTTDAIRFFLARALAHERRSALIVTSAIYAPYQFFSATPHLLAAGVAHAELVGTPTSRDGDSTLLAQRLAQETHAAIGAACAVLHDEKRS